VDESKWRMAGLAAMAGAVVVGATLGLGSRPDPLPASAAISAATDSVPSAVTGTTEVDIVVHVAGEVLRPGLVRLTPGARVADAIAAAGGATADAQLAAINLAGTLADGVQVVVPGVGPLGVVEAVGASGAVDDGRVRVNQADASELDSLPGVGPVLAERIVSYRDLNGPFQAVEDLLDVPGIGESKLAAMRDAIVIP
jgi:competence protein ComEA